MTGTYNLWGTLAYIDKSNGDFYQKKQWEKEFKRFEAKEMQKFIDYYKGINQLYQPFTALLYRAWKNGKLSQFKWFLITNQQ